ncbi:L-fuculose-phosphate aldolase [uncultured Cohaesibacter sp.]|uniref:L-fuculose-phosphate aldolase n=1 Tax=uncultured Cohaesibacter sp. TaxID=1002546 RepID=UPI0029C8E7E8|nr:L-fuculose-phosphate aldolase [uncultured Cohaesibacter sp.]
MTDRMDTRQNRQSIIDAGLEMNATGLNQGTSGNISLRCETGILITPSGIAYDKLVPEDIVLVREDGSCPDEQVPSSEWKFHFAAYRAQKTANAVVHNHALNATTLAILNRPIPAIHYMVAVGGGNDIPVIDYATYGTGALSDLVHEGLIERKAILMRHHGMIATGPTLAKAMWLAGEVEALATLYVNLLQITDTPPCLPDDEIDRVLKKFESYGLREKA